MTLQERFEAKFSKGAPNECWEWAAHIDSAGYGGFRVGRRMVGAHRIAWELANGPIPVGEGSHGTCICHTCDNKSCVNPDHLFSGTHSDNMADMVAKGWAGPLRGEAHGNAKLTDLQVFQIRMIDRDMSQTKIARMFGVGQTQISNILSGKQRKAA